MHETEHAEKKCALPRNSWRYRIKHIRPLANFMSAIFSLIGCGMSMSFLFYGSITNRLSIDIVYDFYLAVVIGVILTSSLASIFPKKFFYNCCGVLSILSGICIAMFEEFEYAPYAVEKSIRSVGGALIFTGLIFSITVSIYIIHCGEISVKYLRGSICSYIQFAIDLGILIGISTIVIINNDYKELLRTQYIIIGTFTIIFGFLSIISAYIFVYESPLTLLENYHAEKATNTLLKLRKETDATNLDIENEMEETRLILNNKSNSIIKCCDMKPALKIVLCRYSYSLATSVTITTIILLFLDYNLEYKLILMFFGRFISNFVPISAIDFKGRKNILKISISGSALFLIISILIKIFAENFHCKTICSYLITVTFFIYNIFLGSGSSSVGYTYMTEFFNYYRKPYINAFIIILEYIPLILLSVFVNLRFEITLLSFIILCAIGPLQFIFGEIAMILLPETKGKTLLEIQNIVKK